MDIDDTASSLDCLMDTIAEVPSLLERSQRMENSDLGDMEYIRDILDKSYQVASWQHAYRFDSDKVVSWTIPSRLHNPSDDKFANKLFPFALEYKCLNDAMLLMFSSAVMLQLLSAAIRTGEANETPANSVWGYQTHQDFDTNSTYPTFLNAERRPWCLPAIKAEADRLARYLCQSMEYCCRCEMGTVGAQATCHSQYALGHYFRRVGLARELDWCKNIKNMDGPGLRRGIDMMLFGGGEETT